MLITNTALAAHPMPADIAIPAYARQRLAPGIVHLGLGAFYRAHVAVYTDALLGQGDERWGIIGVSLRRPDTRDALVAQDYLYTVATRDQDGERLQVVGALMNVLVAPENPLAVVAAMTDPRCHIVTLTVTEKGYCHDPVTLRLRLEHPDIQHDLANPGTPRSALGFIVAALNQRRLAGMAPFTVMSCDNLPANGQTLRGLILEFARAADSQLAQWISIQGAFPSSMVDRIVPKTTAEDGVRISTRLGVSDLWPVMAEPYSQWVIEDNFVGLRPAWEQVGATLVNDVAPYEHAKLRMLNGSHSALAYLGILMGKSTVDQAAADPQLSQFIEAMMREEIEPTLQLADLPVYRAQLLIRFNNPALKHTLQQVAMDGSQKLPQRLLGTIRERLAAGAPCKRLCFVIAGWFYYLLGPEVTGNDYAISDPMQEILQQATASFQNPQQLIVKLLAIREIFGTDLPKHPQFVLLVNQYLEQMIKQGVLTAMADVLE